MKLIEVLVDFRLILAIPTNSARLPWSISTPFCGQRSVGQRDRENPPTNAFSAAAIFRKPVLSEISAYSWEPGLWQSLIMKHDKGDGDQPGRGVIQRFFGRNCWIVNYATGGEVGDRRRQTSLYLMSASSPFYSENTSCKRVYTCATCRQRGPSHMIRSVLNRHMK